MDFTDRVNLLDRTTMNKQYIDPEEIHYSRSQDEFPDHHLGSAPSFLPTSQGVRPTGPSEMNLSSNFDPSSSSSGSDSSRNSEHIDEQVTKAYAPRASAAGRKSTKAALRVRPRNGQHARELERNRHAAANYRSRQKNQLDTLLTRVREEEHKMVKQKSLVYSMKEELWQLRNNLMARQQMQIFGAQNQNTRLSATSLPGQAFGFDPTAETSQQA